MKWNKTPTPDPAAERTPEEQAHAADEGETDTKTADPDPLTRIKMEFEAAKAEADEWRDRCLRKAAEFENFRKRSERERLESANLVKSSVLMEFLPIVDACERALDSFDGDGAESLQSYREGFELLYKQLGDTLSRLGVVPLEAKGKKFDPHLHEALVHQETVEHEDDTIIEELRRGYLFKERLLRPSQVVVANAPKPQTGKFLAAILWAKSSVSIWVRPTHVSPSWKDPQSRSFPTIWGGGLRPRSSPSRKKVTGSWARSPNGRW
jgi:molecular chaperone GrpE